jgi:hypothetical protein
MSLSAMRWGSTMGRTSVKSSRQILEELNNLRGNATELTPPVERTMRANLHCFQSLRDTGLTWQQIASALTEWRQQDNTPITADHLRGLYSRLRRKLNREAGGAKTSERPSRIAPPIRTDEASTSTARPSRPSSNHTLLARLERTTKLRGNE